MSLSHSCESASRRDSPVIVFLLYENRSGSTYLASRLAETPGTIVTIESEAVGELLVPEQPISSLQERDQVIEQLYSEDKFRDWGIARETLLDALKEVALPLKRDGLLLSILRCLPDGAEADCFIIKVPGIKRRFADFVNRYPQFRGLHIYRDPRAVYASQLRAISSRTGRPMVRDPLTAGFRWRAAIEAVESVPGNAVFHLSYEDCLRSEKESVAEVGRFLGREEANAQPSSGGEYLKRIPEAQKHLHARVGSGADTSRIDAWAEELSAGEIFLLESVCKQSMLSRGYSVSERFSLRTLLPVLPKVSANFTLDAAQRLVFKLRAVCAAVARRIGLGHG